MVARRAAVRGETIQKITSAIIGKHYLASIETSHFQGKGKKRAVGWFPASYVKLLAGGEAASGAAASDTSGAAANSAGGEIGDYVLMWVGAMTWTSAETLLELATINS